MKQIRIRLLPLLAVLTLTGCGGEPASSAEQQSTTAYPTTAVTTTITTTATQAEQGCINPWTGETGYSEAALGKRPIAVMVNNITDSLPQYGIAEADWIYELPVEGGITRLMAVYGDAANVPNVCSVRSARYYYSLLAYGMDAIYCHWGADQTIAVDTMNCLQIDHIDGGINGWQKCYFRDEERMKTFSSEHTGYLDGSRLAQTISELGFRIETDTAVPFTFRAPDDIETVGTICNSVNVPFSKYYWSTFTYDSNTQLYQKQHNGSPHMDAKAGMQLAFRNLLILQTDTGLRTDGSLVDVALNGGSGYYVSAGAAQEIRWEKSSENEPIRVYDLKGNAMVFNAGKVYIGILDSNRQITIS